MCKLVNWHFHYDIFFGTLNTIQFLQHLLYLCCSTFTVYTTNLNVDIFGFYMLLIKPVKRKKRKQILDNISMLKLIIKKIQIKNLKKINNKKITRANLSMATNNT